jgi:hypothetical protein
MQRLPSDDCRSKAMIEAYLYADARNYKKYATSSRMFWHSDSEFDIELNDSRIEPTM